MVLGAVAASLAVAAVAWRVHRASRFVPFVLKPEAATGSGAREGDRSPLSDPFRPRSVTPIVPASPSWDPEPEYDWGDESGEDVVGDDGESSDAPRFATAGYRKPVMVQKNCVQESIRIPRELQGSISGPVTVKFAVGRDSTPSRFVVLTHGVDERIAQSIWSAVRECRWIAGADAKGRLTAIWVILPLRFASG